LFFALAPDQPTHPTPEGQQWFSRRVANNRIEESIKNLETEAGHSFSRAQQLAAPFSGSGGSEGRGPPPSA